MNEIENEVVIIGGNHHNMLGVIRTLGENGIQSNIIVTHGNQFAFVTKSKYVKKYFIIEENEIQILKLLDEFKNKNKKCVLIPTSDFAEYVIDKNFDELQKNFILPSINNQQGKIIELMNKLEQYELAKKYKIDMAQTLNLNLNNIEKEIKDITFPCIAKPVASIEGNKEDITICNDIEELEKALKIFEKNNYHRILVQEYLNFDYEYGLIGFAHNKEVIIPGAIEKQRIYPKGRGNVSYGKVYPIDMLKIDISGILNILKDLNFSGMFDIEIFIKGDKYYLNEINFRNSGNAYIYSTKGINIVYLWLLSILGIDTKKEKKYLNKEFYFVDEKLEVRQLLKKNIGLKEWIIAKKKSSSYFVKNKKDIKPYIWKYIYAILRRINRIK